MGEIRVASPGKTGARISLLGMQESFLQCLCNGYRRRQFVSFNMQAKRVLSNRHLPFGLLLSKRLLPLGLLGQNLYFRDKVTMQLHTGTLDNYIGFNILYNSV